MNTGQMSITIIPPLVQSGTSDATPTALSAGGQQAADGGFADVLNMMQQPMPQKLPIEAVVAAQGSVNTPATTAWDDTEAGFYRLPAAETDIADAPPPLASPAETAETDTIPAEHPETSLQPDGGAASQPMAATEMHLLLAAYQQPGRTPEESHPVNRDDDRIQKVSSANSLNAVHQQQTGVPQPATAAVPTTTVAPQATVPARQAQPVAVAGRQLQVRQSEPAETAAGQYQPSVAAVPAQEDIQPLQLPAAEAIQRTSMPESQHAGRRPETVQGTSRFIDTGLDIPAHIPYQQQPVIADQSGTRLTQQSVAPLTTPAELTATQPAIRQPAIPPEAMMSATEQHNQPHSHGLTLQTVAVPDRMVALPVEFEQATTGAVQTAAVVQLQSPRSGTDSNRSFRTPPADTEPRIGTVAAAPRQSGSRPELSTLNSPIIDIVQNKPRQTESVTHEQPLGKPGTLAVSITQPAPAGQELQTNSEAPVLAPRTVRLPAVLTGLNQQQPAPLPATELFSAARASEAVAELSTWRPEMVVTDHQPVRPDQAALPAATITTGKPERHQELPASAEIAVESQRSGRMPEVTSQQDSAADTVQNVPLTTHFQQVVTADYPERSDASQVSLKALHIAPEPAVVSAVQTLPEQKALPAIAENTVAIMLSQQRPLNVAATTIGEWHHPQQPAAMQKRTERSDAATAVVSQPDVSAKPVAALEQVTPLPSIAPTDEPAGSVSRASSTPAAGVVPQQKGDHTAAARVVVSNPEVAMTAIQPTVSLEEAHEHILAPNAALPPLMHAAAPLNKQAAALLQVQSDLPPAVAKEPTVPQQLVAATEAATTTHDTPEQNVNQESSEQEADGRALLQQIPGQSKNVVPSKVVVSPTDARAALPEQVMHQIKERLSQHELKPGAQQISLTLSPENLGDLKMNLNLQGQRLSVEIITDNRTVRDAIMQHVDTLRETLARQNISMESFDVTSGGKGSGGQGQSQQAWRELARQQQMQQFWTSPRGQQPAQTDLPPVKAAFKQQSHSKLDIHY